VICMDRKSQVMLPCSHSYCEQCIDAWQGSHRNCPVCRATVNSANESWVLSERPSADEMTNDATRCVMELVDRYPTTNSADSDTDWVLLCTTAPASASQCMSQAWTHASIFACPLDKSKMITVLSNDYTYFYFMQLNWTLSSMSYMSATADILKSVTLGVLALDFLHNNVFLWSNNNVFIYLFIYHILCDSEKFEIQSQSWELVFRVDDILYVDCCENGLILGDISKT